MGTIRRGSSGLVARLGWERHATDWQVIPTRRRLFQTTRVPPIRIPIVLLWLVTISIAIGVGRMLLHHVW